MEVDAPVILKKQQKFQDNTNVKTRKQHFDRSNGMESRMNADPTLIEGGVFVSGGESPLSGRYDAVMYAGFSTLGRKVSQDAFTVGASNFVTKDSHSYMMFAVLDGHGPCGTAVTKWVATALLEESISAHLRSADSSNNGVRRACKQAFRDIQARLARESLHGGIDAYNSGCCVTVVLLNEDGVHFVWVGDSKAVLVTRPKNAKVLHTEDATYLHHLEDEVEAKRVRKSGGIVRQTKKGVGPLRVYQPGGTLPGLAVSRSIGDELAHSLGVTADPSYKFVPMTADLVGIIVCSDGVWDVMENEEVVKSLFLKPNEPNITENLVCECGKRWIANNRGMSDDITCLRIQMVRDRTPRNKSSS